MHFVKYFWISIRWVFDVVAVVIVWSRISCCTGQELYMAKCGLTQIGINFAHTTLHIIGKLNHTASHSIIHILLHHVDCSRVMKLHRSDFLLIYSESVCDWIDLWLLALMWNWLTEVFVVVMFCYKLCNNCLFSIQSTKWHDSLQINHMVHVEMSWGSKL